MFKRTRHIVDSHQTQQLVGSFSKALLEDDFNHTFRGLPTEMNPLPQAEFTVPTYTIMDLKRFLQVSFNGSVGLGVDSQFYTSGVMPAVWNATRDLDAWIQRVATSMSNAIQTDEPQSRDIYNGQALELGIHVVWGWIVLPILLPASSLLALIITIVETTRSPVGVRRGSPLVLLFMDLDPELRRKALGQVDTTENLFRTIGKARVSVKPDETGNWGFKNR